MEEGGARSGRRRGKEWKRVGQEGVKEGGARSGRGWGKKEWKKAGQEGVEEDIGCWVFAGRLIPIMTTDDTDCH